MLSAPGCACPLFQGHSLYSLTAIDAHEAAPVLLGGAQRSSFMTRDRLLLIDEQMGDLLLTQDLKPMFLNRTSGYILLP
jgi:hypothetical protein